MKYPKELYFCAQYLEDRGFLDPPKLAELKKDLYKFKDRFELVPLKVGYYREMAEELRKLWPTGEKEGKWPWRCSLDSLETRLRSLWKTRNLRQYSIEQCCIVARKYLSQFSEDTKYMRVLKYFVLKQTAIVDADGQIRYVNESLFADMLENTDFSIYETQTNDETVEDYGGYVV